MVGGGAAGIFAAIAAASAPERPQVTVLERGSHFLEKVRISGGGRCNVTHACFEPRDFAARYPRGERALLGAFRRFSSQDTVEWFQTRGVCLKTEADGRMFPSTDRSQSIIDCLLSEAGKHGVILKPNAPVDAIRPEASGGFKVAIGGIESALGADAVLLALGGCRSPAVGELATALGHRLVDPVPSLFTFQVPTPWLRALSGLSLGDVELSVPGTGLRERGALLLTHWGLSGPVTLRLSAWGARVLHERVYRFELVVNLLPDRSMDQIAALVSGFRHSHGARRVTSVPIHPLPSRLWEALVGEAGIDTETRWADLSRSQAHVLVQTLVHLKLPVTGKSLNKDEFVTCGGVRLDEVDFKTMESRIQPGVHFAGEFLDLDGITGGFNFQAAWTTGWIAGRAMAAGPPPTSAE